MSRSADDSWVYRPRVIESFRIRIRNDHLFRERLHKGIGIIALIFFLIWLILPIFWTFHTSLKRFADASAYPPVFWGFEIAWENYVAVLTTQSILAEFQNGLVAASIATVFCLIIGVPHAYAVSKYTERFTRSSFFMILAIRIIPPVSIAVPFFILFQNLGIIDTIRGVILVLTFLFEPFVVWIMKGFFDGLPGSLIDAARTDGCSKFQAFYKIMLPLALPGIGSAVIITWLLAWNHFLLVLIVTSTDAAQTIPIAILNLEQRHAAPINLFSAAAMISMIPSLIVVTVFQRYLVQGLAERRI